MRLAIGILLALTSTVVGAADGQRTNRLSCETWGNKNMDRLMANLPHLSATHVPPHYKIGRCLFELKGKRLIDGKCAYQISKGGDFEIDGPRQVYGGFDYPDCFFGAMAFSTDYFVQVDWEDEKELDDGSAGPGWEAFWNEDKRNTHAQGFLGPVKRHGACYSNAETKICLWKK